MDEAGKYKTDIEKYVARVSSLPHVRVVVSSRETGFDHTHFRGALSVLYQILPLTGAMKKEVIHKRLVATQPPRCTARQVRLKLAKSTRLFYIDQPPSLLPPFSPPFSPLPPFSPPLSLPLSHSHFLTPTFSRPLSPPPL
jgi:hypothetical protein